MTVAAMVMNRNVFKFALALSIPALMIAFFYYANDQATKEIKDLKQQEKDHPSTDKIVINNYAMKEIDDGNNIRWQLIAHSGTLQPNGKDVLLDKVQVDYFDKVTHALKMRLTAPLGTADQQTKFVKLNGLNGEKVIAEGEGGKSKFMADQVELIKSNQFLASGGVIVDWPGVAKVSGNSASGSTDMAAGPKDLKIVGNTHSLIMAR